MTQSTTGGWWTPNILYLNWSVSRRTGVTIHAVGGSMVFEALGSRPYLFFHLVSYVLEEIIYIYMYIFIYIYIY